MLRQTSIILILLLFLLFFGCTPRQTIPVEKMFSDQKTTNIITSIDQEQKKVVSFIYRGNLAIKEKNENFETLFFAAGNKSPFVLKMEITHPWGQPIFHILISQDKLEVLSFYEKAYYFGKFNPQVLSRFLKFKISPDIIWAVLRGYPFILEHNNSFLEDNNQLSLLDKNNKIVECIRINADSLSPEAIFLPKEQLDFKFSKFIKKAEIWFGSEVEIIQTNKNKALSLNHGDILFNDSIPSEIFSLSKPPSFKSIEIDQQSIGNETQ